MDRVFVAAYCISLLVLGVASPAPIFAQTLPFSNTGIPRDKLAVSVKQFAEIPAN
jgi:hypothetical protein